MLSFRTPVVALLILWFSQAVALAHPGIDDRTEHVSDLLRAAPNDVQLRLRRAKLHAEHGDHVAAEADLRKAREIAPGDPRVDVLWGQQLLRRGDSRGALRHANRALQLQLSWTPAQILKSRSLAKLGRHAAAARAMTRALERSGTATVDLVLEATDFYIRAGQLDRALEVVRRGISELEVRPGLVLKAMEIEQLRGRPAAALSWFDELPASMKAMPRWMLKNGDLLERAGRRAAALVVYLRVLQTLESYPATRRDVPARKLLRQEALQKVRALDLVRYRVSVH